jgi:hypothetical protein
MDDTLGFAFAFFCLQGTVAHTKFTIPITQKNVINPDLAYGPRSHMCKHLAARIEKGQCVFGTSCCYITVGLYIQYMLCIGYHSPRTLKHGKQIAPWVVASLKVTCRSLRTPQPGLRGHDDQHDDWTVSISRKHHQQL